MASTYSILKLGFLFIVLSVLLSACGRNNGAMYLPSSPVPYIPQVQSWQLGAQEPPQREKYHSFSDHPVHIVTERPISTFSIDVDTGSYSNVRRFLRQGQLPHIDAVRVEEMLNYFDYSYPPPDNLEQPFAIHTEMAPSPWNPANLLLHIGIKGYEVAAAQLPAANLVFLIDVSGSMRDADKLPLLVRSLRILTERLRRQDRISIVVYAGAAGVVLPPTAGDEKDDILAALDRLTAGGSTHGAQGIQLAYALAEKAYIHAGVNRILLATDGDFNVGIVDFAALKQLVSEKRKTGIALTTLGFGTGNYNDHLMEQLAAAGNGNYFYIDQINEAKKVLSEQMSSTVLTIAKDVKIQLEFNPAQVAEYRLIGYENRAVRREDFNNDHVDAGDIGAGHRVTAIYEISLAGGKGARNDPLRYRAADHPGKPEMRELAFIKIRYKSPEEVQSKLIWFAVPASQIKTDIAATSSDFKFSAAVAAFGQKLRGGQYLKQMTHAQIIQLALSAMEQDPYGYRKEFVQLVGKAQKLGSPSVKVD